MLSINGTFLIQLGFFLAFMAIVNLFLFRPMRVYLARRQRTIDNLRASAGGSESAFTTLATEYNRRLTEASDEMAGCRASARKDGLAKQRAVLEEAKRQAIIEVDASEDALAKDVAAAREHLQGEARALAAAIAGKVVGRAR
jgi:F0F1-type ATP synthase membrane subunit b/b'